MSYPERIVPDEAEPGIVALHLKRYRFARAFCGGRDVLDAACGVGYGSAELAGPARRVVGVDVDPEAVAYARSRYAAPELEFAVMDLASLDFPDGSFDVACAFEAIEHVADPERVVAEIARVLRDGGTLVASTPHAAQTTERPDNPFHTVEYAPADFERLLHRSFDRVELYGQHRRRTRRHRLLTRVDVLGLRRRVRPPRAAETLLGSPPTEAITLDDVVIEPGALDGASEVVAVCTGPRRG